MFLHKFGVFDFAATKRDLPVRMRTTSKTMNMPRNKPIKKNTEGEAYGEKVYCNNLNRVFCGN